VCREHPTLVSEGDLYRQEDTALAAERSRPAPIPTYLPSSAPVRRRSVWARPIRYPFQDREDNLTEFVLVRLAWR
jgi:hypothetical protein